MKSIIKTLKFKPSIECSRQVDKLVNGKYQNIIATHTYQNINEYVMLIKLEVFYKSHEEN
jgi:hypothetical protein